MADTVKPTNAGSVPVPDPTALTRQASEDLEKRLREFVRDMVKSERDLTEQKLIAHNEKFTAIDQRFNERDKRAVQMSEANKSTVEAALLAAKDLGNERNRLSDLAINKSEAAFNKQFDQIGHLINTTDGSTQIQFGDVKTRLTTIESRKQGASEIWAMVLSVAGMVAALAAVIVVLVKP